MIIQVNITNDMLDDLIPALQTYRWILYYDILYISDTNHIDADVHVFVQKYLDNTSYCCLTQLDIASLPDKVKTWCLHEIKEQEYLCQQQDIQQKLYQDWQTLERIEHNLFGEEDTRCQNAKNQEDRPKKTILQTVMNSWNKLVCQKILHQKQ